jgi:hypothetical protein
MFDYNENEKQAVLEKYFSDSKTLNLIAFPKKQKQKFLCLLWIITLFEKDRTYTEKEVNSLLKEVHPDFVMIRRYLIDYKLLTREKDCSKYWVNQNK